MNFDSSKVYVVKGKKLARLNIRRVWNWKTTIGGANLKRPGKERKLTWSRDWKINKWLYFLAIPIFLYFFIFNYLPMFGLVIAFQDFKPQLGVFGSKLVGWKNFETFFGGPNFLTILRNTLVISGDRKSVV